MEGKKAEGKKADTPATPQEAFYTSAYEVAKAAVERARSGAQFVQTAAAAVVTLYTGALAVAFSATSSPLPLRGLIPAVYLGLAVALAAFYLAFPSTTVERVSIPPAAGSTEEPAAWFTSFTGWTQGIILRRRTALRTALFALLLGVIFLPTPFVKVKTSTPTAPKLTEWPTKTSVGNVQLDLSDIQLQRILYRAQVAEVAKLREKAAPQPKGEFTVRERWVWWAFAGGLLFLLLSLIPWHGTPPVPFIPGTIPIGTFGKRQ